jgi:hypothetical protein
MNARQHGFAGRIVVIPEEEQPYFQDALQSLLDEHKPQTATEKFLVQSLAELTWTLSGIRANELNLMAIMGETAKSPVQSDDEKTNYALNQATGSLDRVRDLNTLSIYEQRKMRALRETLKELSALQAIRKAAELADFKLAAVYRKQIEPDKNWRPEQDGFVCSLEDLDAFVVLQEWRKLVERDPLYK